MRAGAIFRHSSPQLERLCGRFLRAAAGFNAVLWVTHQRLRSPRRRMAPPPGWGALWLLACLAALCWAPTSRAQAAPAEAIRLHDHSAGLDLDAALTAFAESPADRRYLAVGSAEGQIYLSSDRGQSWRQAAETDPGWGLPTLRSDRAQSLTGDLATNPLDAGSMPRLRNYLSGVPPNEAFHQVDRNQLNLVFPRLRMFGPYEALVDPYEDATMWPERGDRERWGRGSPRLVRWAQRYWRLPRPQWPAQTRGRAGAAVHALGIDPVRPERLLAATDAGLRLSEDGGHSWHTPAGAPEGIATRALLRDARQAQRLWVGGDGGLQLSADGGARFYALPATQGLRVRALSAHPQDSRQMLLSTATGLWETRDGGRTVTVRLRTAGEITAALYDPARPERLLAGGPGGLWRSLDGGQTFERVGGLAFIEQPVRALSAGEGAGHFWALIGDEVWRSLDGGDHWAPLLALPELRTPRALWASSFEAGAQWLLGERRLWRLSAEAAAPLSAAAQRRFEQLRRREPSARALWAAAERRLGLDRGGAEGWARWANTLPRLSAGFYQSEIFLPGATREIYGLGGAERFLSDTLLSRRPQFFVFAGWDLVRLFDGEGQARPQIVARQAAVARLRATLNAIERERRQLQWALLQGGAAQPHTRLRQALRLEALDAQLEALAGDVFVAKDLLEWAHWGAEE